MTEVVTVLLATYNAGEFLTDQLESIAAQSGVRVHLLVSDDGSSDSTVPTLESYRKAFPDFSLIEGPRKGPAANFSHLLSKAPDSNFVAFADQDDVWDTDKLERALSRIQKDRPSLYYSRVRTSMGMTPSNFPLDGNSSFFGNAAMGCTQVLSPRLRSELIKVKDLRPQQIPIDWWHWFVAIQFFEVAHDSTPTMTYRLHHNNAIGIPSNSTRALRFVQRVVRDRQLLSKTTTSLFLAVRELEDVFERPAIGRDVAVSRTLRARLKVLTSNKFRTHRGEDFLTKLGYLARPTSD